MEAATSANTEDGGWGSTIGETGTIVPDDASVAPVTAGQADDFSAAGGWGDAPAPKELEKAAKAQGTEWEEEIKKPVQTAAPVLKPKMTWAQIAK